MTTTSFAPTNAAVCLVGQFAEDATNPGGHTNALHWGDNSVHTTAGWYSEMAFVFTGTQLQLLCSIDANAGLSYKVDGGSWVQWGNNNGSAGVTWTTFGPSGLSALADCDHYIVLKTTIASGFGTRVWVDLTAGIVVTGASPAIRAINPLDQWYIYTPPDSGSAIALSYNAHTTSSAQLLAFGATAATIQTAITTATASQGLGLTGAQVSAIGTNSFLVMIPAAVASLNIPLYVASGGGQVVTNKGFDVYHPYGYSIYYPADFNASDNFGANQPTGKYIYTAVLPTPQTITSATGNAVNPVVCTLINHGLSNGNLIEITGAAGNTALNGVWPATLIDANTFSLPTTGNGTYTGSSATMYANLFAFEDAAASLGGTGGGLMTRFATSKYHGPYTAQVPSGGFFNASECVRWLGGGSEIWAYVAGSGAFGAANSLVLTLRQGQNGISYSTWSQDVDNHFTTEARWIRLGTNLSNNYLTEYSLVIEQGNYITGSEIIALSMQAPLVHGAPSVRPQVIGVGDSFTASAGLGFPEVSDWSVISKCLSFGAWNRGIGGTTLHNFTGTSGLIDGSNNAFTANSVEGRIANITAIANPKICRLMIGTNDVTQSTYNATHVTLTGIFLSDNQGDQLNSWVPPGSGSSISLTYNSITTSGGQLFPFNASAATIQTAAQTATGSGGLGLTGAIVVANTAGGFNIIIPNAVAVVGQNLSSSAGTLVNIGTANFTVAQFLTSANAVMAAMNAAWTTTTVIVAAILSQLLPQPDSTVWGARNITAWKTLFNAVLATAAATANTNGPCKFVYVDATHSPAGDWNPQPYPAGDTLESWHPNPQGYAKEASAYLQAYLVATQSSFRLITLGGGING